MKRMIAILIVGLVPLQASAQGTFVWSNPTAPTRLYKLDGPLAGTGIWGQMLVGTDAGNVMPLGIATEHIRIGNRSTGIVSGLGNGIVSVPGIECRQFTYIQFVAWDGEAWGTDLEFVPEHQLGRTDIVSHLLAGCLGDPETAPRFTQPAMVPPIPEPSTMALLLLAGGAAIISTRRFRRYPGGWGRTRTTCLTTTR